MKRVGVLAAILGLPLLAAAATAWLASERRWLFRELPVPDPAVLLRQTAACVESRWSGLTNHFRIAADQARIADALLGHELGETPDPALLSAIRAGLQGCRWLGLFTIDGVLIAQDGVSGSLPTNLPWFGKESPEAAGWQVLPGAAGDWLVSQAGHNRFGRVIGRLVAGYATLADVLGEVPGLQAVGIHGRAALLSDPAAVSDSVFLYAEDGPVFNEKAAGEAGLSFASVQLAGWDTPLVILVADPGLLERVLWVALPAAGSALLVALPVLLIVGTLARRRRRRLMLLQEELEQLGTADEQSAAGVEALIRHAEMLERRDAPEGAEPETVPVLAEVLGKEGGGKGARHDSELDTLISKVVGPGGPAPAMETEHAAAETTEPGILGVAGTAAYWEMMHPIVRDTLRVTRSLLLLPDAAGVFRAGESVNIDPRIREAFVIRPDDGLFQRILGKKKVLFLKERAMESRVIAALLPGESAETVSQLAIVPVVDAAGAIVALLVLLKSAGEVPLDIYALYETMYLSIL